MWHPRQIQSFWRNLFHREQLERELDDELRFYLDEVVDRNISQGMSSDEARRAARMSMGSVEQVKERVRDARVGAWIASVVQDLRYGLIQLRRNPGFTAVAVITLALGVGANTAIFSVVDAVLLRALPFKDPKHLVMLWETEPSAPGGHFPVAGPDFKDWLVQNNVFQNIEAGTQDRGVLTGSGEPLLLTGDSVSPGVFGLLGIQPLYGRTFIPDESEPGRGHVIILSYGLWQRAFGGNKRIIGQNITLNGEAYSVVGVMPRQLRFPEIWNWKAEYWVPINFAQPAWKEDRSTHWLWVMARMKPGVTIDQARADMGAVSLRLAQQYPKTNKGVITKVVSLHDQLIGNVRPMLMALFGVVSFLLLIACINVVSLLLARTIAREREIAVRLAVGCRRLRIVRQLLTESVFLFVFSSVVGLAVGWGALHLLLHTAPSGYIPNVTQVGLNSTVFASALLVAFLAGLLGGLVPAIQSSRMDLHETLKEGGRTLSSPRQRFRSMLVISEIALALMMLFSSGLAIRSLVRLLDVNAGFDARNVLTLRVFLPKSSYPKPTQVVSFYQRVLTKVRSLPGVVSAAAATELPLLGGNNTTVYAEGHSFQENGSSALLAEICWATPHYFRTLHIPLLRGRDFAASDTASSLPVAIVNRTMAKLLWPHENPIGKRFTENQNSPKWITVVGVVGDVHVSGLNSGLSPEAYFPEYQDAKPTIVLGLVLVIRTVVSPDSLVSAVRSAVQSIDNNIPIYQVRQLSEIVSASSGQERFLALLLMLFAVVALLLAAIGIYGVLAYSIASQRHALGIRMALGASRPDVLQLVLIQGMKLAFAGVTFGIVGALVFSRLLASLLYGVSPTDPLTFFSVSFILLGVAFLACYIPAHRVVGAALMLVLRGE